MSDRYARQIVLPEIGAGGQARLAAATVLIVGAGGLGCPALSYLAGAGVGRIVLVDHDVVEESNLHRQPLYAMSDLGRPKVEAARDAIGRYNPAVTVEAIAERLTPSNAPALVADADVVIDAADSFAVTYTLSDACRDHGTPLVSASVIGLSGYAGGFCGGAPSYRAVFPDMPAQAASCATAGVMGPAVAVLGGLEAQFTLHILLGLQPSPLARIVTYDAARLSFGGFSFAGAPEPEGAALPFIAPDEVRPEDFVVELRGVEETPVPPFPQAHRVGVEEIETIIGKVPEDARIVLCCRTGLRSAKAGKRLANRGLTRLALIAMGD